ncbi:MAG: hypothetical protein KA161_08210 [Saprospiraceae bacterium]|nr:hypothetical protein [Saprospiraceae bacterium]
MDALKYRIYLLLCIYLPGCKSLENHSGKLFFDYDTIHHYSIIMDESQVNELYDLKSASALDSLRYTIILDETPATITDTAFIVNLENIGYKKTTIDTSIYNDINSIFMEKKTEEILGTSCIYIYRDMLIFRKMGEISGMAKICFDCMAHHIVGTEANTEYFGQNGDYARLQKFLYH